MIGVTVRARNIVIPLYRGVAMRAKRYEIIEFVGVCPIVVKLAPRNNVVNVKRASQFILGDTAALAGMIVTFISPFALVIPVGSAPLLITTLPVAMILAPLPLGRALIGAETTSILVAFNLVTVHVNGLAADFASELGASRLGLTLTATETHIAMLIAVAIDLKGFAASLAGHLNGVTLGLVSTFEGTETIHARRGVFEVLAAIFTFMARVFDRLPKAFARAIPLALAVRGIELAADFTLSLFHTLIIPQSGRCASMSLARGFCD